MEANRNSAARWLYGLVALILVCRLLPLTHEVTGDEVFSARMAALPVGELVARAPDWDTHPPLYYILLGAMPTQPGGAVSLRLLSILAGLLQLGVLWAIGRHMAGSRLGWIFVALVGVNLLFCRHGALARNYVLLQLLATTAWLVLLHALRRGGAWRWTLLAFLYALGCWTFYYAAHAIAALTVFFLLTRPKRGQVKAYALVLLGTAALFAPWIPSFVEQVERVRALTSTGWYAADGSVSWITNHLLRRHVFTIGPWGSWWALGAVGGVMVLALARPKWFGAAPRDAQATASARWLVPVAGAVAAYLLVAIVAGLLGSFSRAHYAGFLGTILCVGLGLVLFRLPRLGTALALALAMGAAVHTVMSTLSRSDFGAQAATEVILNSNEEGGVVLCLNADGKLLYDFHAVGGGPAAFGVYEGRRPGDVPPWDQPMLVLSDSASIESALSDRKHLWCLWFAAELGGTDAESRLRHVLEQRGWRSMSTKTWRKDVRLERFGRAPEEPR